MDQPAIFSFLKEHYLFHSLQDGEVEQITRLFKPTTLQNGETLYHRGKPGKNFFIIVSGDVTLHYSEGRATQVGWREHFGEEALLNDQPRLATARAAGETTLLSLHERPFHLLLDTFPAIKSMLVAINDSDRLARTQPFAWLGEEEKIRFIDRKHILTFYSSLILPFLLAALTTAAIFFLQLDLLIFLPLAFVFYGSWTVWNWIDWGNDFYIVTSERVAWVEKVVWLHDQRREVPLGSVLSVNISTHQMQRLIGYGDVIIRTYTGNMPMGNAGHPAVLSALIQEAHFVSQERYKQTEAAKIDETIRDRLSDREGGTQPPGMQAPLAETGQETLPRTTESITFFQQFLNLFRDRYELEGVITYRKHKFVLLLKSWWLVLTFVGLVTAFFARLVNLISAPTLTLIAVTASFNLLILLYIFADWANDRFQLTRKQVIDIDRKPLGQETKRSALLENILSLDYKRKNVIQRLFNFGTVAINVGDIQLDFENVAKPKRVQNEIFEFYDAALKRKEREQAQRHREDMVEFLAAYHRQQQHSGQSPDEENPTTEE